jgi:hypothetical protein
MIGTLIFAIICLVLLPMAWLWVTRIDYMYKNHPDYKGEDLFDEDEKDDIENKDNSQ